MNAEIGTHFHQKEMICHFMLASLKSIEKYYCICSCLSAVTKKLINNLWEGDLVWAHHFGVQRHEAGGHTVSIGCLV